MKAVWLPPPWQAIACRFFTGAGIGGEAASRSLEDVAKPLTAHEEEAEAPA